MMRPAAEVRVYLCREPVDFRRGICGLSLLVEQGLGLDPFAAALYVFVNKYRNRIRILYWLLPVAETPGARAFSVAASSRWRHRHLDRARVEWLARRLRFMAQ
jgi:hypothetical protein